MKLAVKMYDLLILLTRNLRSLFLLAIRATWGWQFFQDGLGKMRHIDDVTNYFNDLHKDFPYLIPFPRLNAEMVGVTELVGGLFLLAGLGGRFWAVALTIVMSMAYATGDRDSLASLDKFVVAGPFPYLFASLVVMIFGPGRYSIDFLIQHFVIKRPDKAL
jgi:putative oxidoreductase